MKTEIFDPNMMIFFFFLISTNELFKFQVWDAKCLTKWKSLKNSQCHVAEKILHRILIFSALDPLSQTKIEQKKKIKSWCRIMKNVQKYFLYDLLPTQSQRAGGFELLKYDLWLVLHIFLFREMFSDFFHGHIQFLSELYYFRALSNILTWQIDARPGRGADLLIE